MIDNKFKKKKSLNYFDSMGSILTNVATLPVFCIAVKTSSADIGDEHVTRTNFLSKEISYFSTPLPKIENKNNQSQAH